MVFIFFFTRSLFTFYFVGGHGGTIACVLRSEGPSHGSQGEHRLGGRSLYTLLGLPLFVAVAAGFLGFFPPPLF